MNNPRAFIEQRRVEPGHRKVSERITDYDEINIPLPEDLLKDQAMRCMDCGIPFCHGLGCPVHNRMPEFNELIYNGNWKEACKNLHSTNNFPEITGRICPAPCEAACTLNMDTSSGIADRIGPQPVLIKHIELQIVERGFVEGWVKPQVAPIKTNKRIAVVGSGPAGLAAAQQLARAGHDVVVFEKALAIGGLLRYGIPDFKLDKGIIDRRLEQMSAEGVEFQTGVIIGEDISAKYLQRQFDAICLTMGAGVPRNLNVTGRGLENIHFAMDYLTQQNRINAGEDIADQRRISARGKNVVVIGGGDTGSDCVGTAIRQGAKKVHQFEIMPKPPKGTNSQTPWPLWPNILRTSTSQEEGCERRWCVKTKSFAGVGIKVATVKGCEVQWTQSNGKWDMADVPGSDFSIPTDLVLLAMGFEHVTHSGLVESLALDLDSRGNTSVDNFHTSTEGVFSAGDMVSGPSLVVRAIAAGRDLAGAVDNWLARV